MLKIYFTQIDPNLGEDIGTSTRSLKKTLKNLLKDQPEKVIPVNEFKSAFFPLKVDERAGYDDISFNVVKKIFWSFT